VKKHPFTPQALVTCSALRCRNFRGLTGWVAGACCVVGVSYDTNQAKPR
jgi:hypothetical protein